jgi:chemotaxis protein MotB
MISSRRKPSEAREETTNFWVSYSDLMAAVLLVFALLLVVSMMHYSDFISDQTDLMRQFAKIEKRIINNVSQSVVGENVSINPETGALQIHAGILFSEGSYNLSAEGKQRLKEVFQNYISVVLDPEFKDYVKSIEIEGHTNSNGTYLYNLELSQQRALAVLNELFAQNKDADARTELQSMVVASGRSFSQLIRDENGVEDKVRSRRIEIKFRLKEDEMFRQINANFGD